MASGLVKVHSLNTNENNADLDTKPMQKPRPLKLRDWCGPRRLKFQQTIETT